MEILPKTLLVVLTLNAVVLCTSVNAQRQPPPKAIKVILKVEAQGPEGLWMQLGKDLSPAELNQLRSMIATELGKLPNHKLVSPEDKDDDLGLAVVVEKLQVGPETVFVLSGALTVAKANGTDLLVTHDVIAEPSLALAAKAVVGQLSGAELRSILPFGKR
jgi:hypothetical protein